MGSLYLMFSDFDIASSGYGDSFTDKAHLIDGFSRLLSQMPQDLLTLDTFQIEFAE